MLIKEHRLCMNIEDLRQSKLALQVEGAAGSLEQMMRGRRADVGK